MSITSEKLRHRREQAARDVLKGMGISTWNSFSSGSGGGGVSSAWVDENYISKEFFNEAFTIHTTITVTVTDEHGDPVGEPTVTESTLAPNELPGTVINVDDETGYTTTTTVAITSIEAKKGLWTNYFVSALGANSGGGGGGTVLLEPLASINNAGLAAHPSVAGQTVVWNGSAWVYGSTGGSGTVTSVGLSVPSGSRLIVNQSPVTTIGTIALSIESGYSIPSTSKQSNWDTAYNWVSMSRSTLADYGITDAKINSGTITLGSNTITPWTGSNHPTTLSGYGITDAKFGTASGTTRPITLGSVTQNVLIAHQSLSGYATQDWVQGQGYLTSSSFSSFIASDEKLSITIGGTTRTAQAPTIADLGVNAEAASSSSVPSSKFPGVKLGTKTGLYMTKVYDTATPPSATPVPYGNIINIIGGGGGQILAQWHGSYDTGHLYYRSHRDTTASGGWTPWKKVAFTDDAVASADKLTTARTLWGQSFNGTANVTGNMTSVGSIAASGEIKTSNGNAFRLSYGNVGTILRSDSTSFHVLFTDSGSADAGTWNSLRPLSINKTSGIVRMENGLYVYNANQPNANSDGFNALRIGNAVLSWDSTNNALKVSKYDGTAVNFYSLGGVSALGFSAGSTSTSITNLTVTNRLTIQDGGTIASDGELYIGSNSNDATIFVNDIGSMMDYDLWHIGAETGYATFARTYCPRFYFDNTRYLQYSGGHLQFYNGTSFINLT